MFNGSRVLAIIPARGGSKGIPKKNIAQLAGKPLISYTTELTQDLPWLDSTVVSTDSQEIAETATQTPGVEIVWRPEELSGDRIGDHPVLRHALSAREEQTGERYDIVLMLQPTSPLRTVDDVEGCITTLQNGDWDAVWSVSETELTYHPRKTIGAVPAGQPQLCHPRRLQNSCQAGTRVRFSSKRSVLCLHPGFLGGLGIDLLGVQNISGHHFGSSHQHRHYRRSGCCRENHRGWERLGPVACLIISPHDDSSVDDN